MLVSHCSDLLRCHDVQKLSLESFFPPLLCEGPRNRSAIQLRPLKMSRCVSGRGNGGGKHDEYCDCRVFEILCVGLVRSRIRIESRYAVAKIEEDDVFHVYDSGEQALCNDKVIHTNRNCPNTGLIAAQPRSVYNQYAKAGEPTGSLLCGP